MSDIPQFGTAEYHPEAGGNSCKTCGLAITGRYFRVSGAMTCPACAEKTTGSLPRDTHGAYARGILFGAVGAVLGLTVYSVVGIVTGLEIGYVSLLVGFIVGRAVLLGASGVGGRRYQITAALLTYAAVSMSAVPISLWQYTHENESKTPPITEPAAVPPFEATNVADDPVPSSEASEPNLLGAIGYLAVLGLASPLLGLAELPSGLIGLVILFVGIRIAWKMTAGSSIQVMGPYQV